MTTPLYLAQMATLLDDQHRAGLRAQWGPRRPRRPRIRITPHAVRRAVPGRAARAH